MSKQSRGDKGELIVIETLKKIKVKHHLLNDVMFQVGKNEMTHQIDHILIHPHGVFVIETKNYYGKIISDTGDSYWLKVIKNEEIKISNPLKQNKSHSVVVYRLLKGKYEVVPVVVFVKNNAPYIGDENVINLSDLLLFIDSYPYKKKLSEKSIDEINNILEKNISDISKDEHVETIGYLKQMKEEFRRDMTFAIENNKCPWCGSPIIKRGYEYKCGKCKFAFKL